MVQDLEHVVQNLLVHRFLCFVFVDAADSAHGLVPAPISWVYLRQELAGLCTMRGAPAVISQDVLVNLNNSLCYGWFGMMLYLLPPLRSLIVAQDISETRGEILHVWLTDVTPVSLADDFADISHIRGHHR